ncbi:hypothetical protein CathTA2_0893 [Caldalkalibacillus thermarum TA2.A1]|nr:hypothetical protein CathTA2_0893 [Caldalkalibacillus thermarum TA2.A1]
MMEIGRKFELENELSEQIKQLEQQGLWVFGDRIINKETQWVTAIVEIYSKNNPLINTSSLINYSTIRQLNLQVGKQLRFFRFLITPFI